MKSKRNSAPAILPLSAAVRLDGDKVISPDSALADREIQSGIPVLVVLAAGKGTRFGAAPKCVQLVRGTPLARHTIESFRKFSSSPVICIVGHRHDEVLAALGAENVYIRSDNPVGGTAYAAFEAFCLPRLIEARPLMMIAMGDRILTPEVFARLNRVHGAGGREADLTFMTAIHASPKNHGKGRVVRDAGGRVKRIVEQRDIEAIAEGAERQRLQNITECNCPLYAIRADTLHQYLHSLSNANAQRQYYLTDIVEDISRQAGDIRTVQVSPSDPEYDLLCSDITRPEDIVSLERIVASCDVLQVAWRSDIDLAARLIMANRPAVQAHAIAGQIEMLVAAAEREKLGFRPSDPVGLGVSGGRLRIAFMHPDMTRFFGPAWQMAIGAGTASGEEQIVMLAQRADDGLIHLFPAQAKYRERANVVAADMPEMYPDETVTDLHAYEVFGTRMSEKLLQSLGYVSDKEIQQRRLSGRPVPELSLHVSGNMRRPFCLIGNGLASLRTLREGTVGDKVHASLGRGSFRGLRIAIAGNIPQGGFSSSSAVTVATINSVNALYDLGLDPERLVSLACQAEYGTGVRAGSLDQATEQKGRPGEGALISSNPSDGYRVLGTYPVPAQRFKVLFPYSVERDMSAWRWSWGAYAEAPGFGRPSAGEMRKLTGKAAEIAAVLLRLPLDTDWFKHVENDLIETGDLSQANRRWIAGVLRQLPLRVAKEDLHHRLRCNRSWYVDQLRAAENLDPDTAARNADATLASLFSGWNDPVLRRATPSGAVVEESGVPLRAMLAYLFAEVARNFRLIHHPHEWVRCVTWSQLGDRSVDIAPERLPTRVAMESALGWEHGVAGPHLLDRWLEHASATPHDYQRGLDDESLNAADPPEFHLLEGGSFFRGLALIDLAEAMLKRAFGLDSVAVRVNAAGQGDYFQVHVDTRLADVEAVKRFIRLAFYRRFGLSPEAEFVEVHPGGGAVGVRLDRYDSLISLARMLKRNQKPAIRN